MEISLGLYVAVHIHITQDILTHLQILKSIRAVNINTVCQMPKRLEFMDSLEITPMILALLYCLNYRNTEKSLQKINANITQQYLP